MPLEGGGEAVDVSVSACLKCGRSGFGGNLVFNESLTERVESFSEHASRSADIEAGEPCALRAEHCAVVEGAF